MRLAAHHSLSRINQWKSIFGKHAGRLALFVLPIHHQKIWGMRLPRGNGAILCSTPLTLEKTADPPWGGCGLLQWSPPGRKIRGPLGPVKKCSPPLCSKPVLMYDSLAILLYWTLQLHALLSNCQKLTSSDWKPVEPNHGFSDCGQSLTVNIVS